MEHTDRDAADRHAAVVIACHGQQPVLAPATGTVPTSEAESR